jgi:hypothetical protein
MALIKRDDANSVSKVKGPIRCHKCQVICRDAKHYLSHQCGLNSSCGSSAFPPLTSTNRDSPHRR